MPIYNKPGNSEPIAIAEKDSFGNTVLRLTDPWRAYFDSVDSEVNVTINQTINSTVQSSNSFSSADAVEIEKISKEIQAIRALIKLEPQQNYDNEIKQIKSMLAQLLAREQEPTRDNNVWLSTLGNHPA